MSPELDLGELLANDASRICFRWPEMAVFRVSVKVAEISYPSTFSVVEFLGIGGLIQTACPELVGHFFGNLYVFIMGVPRIKVFQIDCRHL